MPANYWEVLIVMGAGCAIVMASLLVGYFMGRNSAEKPIISKEIRPFNPGPTDDPGGDPFEEALRPEEDPEERFPTMS